MAARGSPPCSASSLRADLGPQTRCSAADVGRRGGMMMSEGHDDALRAACAPRGGPKRRHATGVRDDPDRSLVGRLREPFATPTHQVGSNDVMNTELDIDLNEDPPAPRAAVPVVIVVGPSDEPAQRPLHLRVFGQRSGRGDAGQPTRGAFGRPSPLRSLTRLGPRKRGSSYSLVRASSASSRTLGSLSRVAWRRTLSASPSRPKAQAACPRTSG